MPDTYAQSWKWYRRVRITELLCVAAFIVEYLAVRFETPLLGANGLLHLLMGTIAAIAIALMILRNWVCPRCKKLFSQNYISLWPGKGTQQCIHCGLPKFASEAEAERVSYEEKNQ